jgi:NTP pyrophosphatase (non-canonical NTP hydrolase)
MDTELIRKVFTEEEKALEKWGGHDQIPDNLLSAVLEEAGEVAHAINHNEGKEKAQLEIAQTIGVLSRLYNMIENMQEV